MEAQAVETFIQITEAIKIIQSKYTDHKLPIINTYIEQLGDIIIKIEQEKNGKYKYYSLQTIIPLIKPEIIRFNAQYEELTKKDEEDDGYTPLHITEENNE